MQRRSMSSSKALQAGSSLSLLSSSSSSSSIRPWTHDVFLSFRGDDVRQKFVSHLYAALHKRGINTYIDNNLEKGEEISPELLKAIDGSMISIIVLSKNYSDSRWCLDELLKILECKETVKQIVLPLFYDVDPSDVRHQKGSFGEAFTRVECKFKADKVKLTEWKAALEKVANLSGFELGKRNESDFILDIITHVDSVMVNRTSFNVAKYLVGVESRVQDIYQHLSMERNDIVCMVGIFGTGGIGKTTISKDIYNRISYKFEGSCFLENIRETSEQVGGFVKLQNTLLAEILGENLDVHYFDRGINVISHRLHSKRVLLILDDVATSEQLEKLAGDRKWFGPGSRIIVTTRDQHLLNISKVDSKYELKIMAGNEARKLFSLHAFEKEEPLDGYAEVFEQVIQYAQGLPLALTVLGSNLKGKTDVRQWESVLDIYKQIPDKKIQSVLQVSYDGLEEYEKDMFLDIACFFNGEPLADVMKIFEGCHFHPNYGIPKLIDKCLITAESHIWMHNLLQDMGREVVRKESLKKPGARSRLWSYEDIRQVLEENTGTNNVEGIKVNLLGGHNHDDMIRLSPKVFAKMKRLRVFISHGACFSGRVLSYLSNELRVLDWSDCPLQSLPSNFRGEKLVVFRMYQGRIKEIISGKFKSLTIMQFFACKFLTKIPDLSSCSNLEKLDIVVCENLVEVHDSVGFLDKLDDLYLNGCPSLKSFPRHLKLRSLRYLTLLNCSKLQNFPPQIECKMELLSSIDLEGTPIKEWPSSNIRYLTPALNSLSLRQRIRPSQNQKELCLSDYAITLEEDEDEWDSSVNGCFIGIEHLYIEGSMDLVHPSNHAIDAIHSSIGYLGRLTLRLKSYPLCPSPDFNNRYLDRFSFYCSSTLQELDLSFSVIVNLPPSIESFFKLRILKLRECYSLQEILHLPPNIQELYAYDCCSLERCPEVSTKFQFYKCGLRELRWINLSNCHKLDANIGSQEPNPSFVEEHIQDHSCGIIFPGNKIPDWFNHTKKTSYSHSCELDISGLLYLDKIIGIVFCAVLGKDPDNPFGPSSSICVSINSNMLVEANFELLRDWDHVYLNYSFQKCIKQWLRYPTEDNLRFRFYCAEDAVMIKSCGVHIIYKHEENENLTVGECSIDSSNGIQISKRRRDDEGSNLEFKGYPQHKRRSQNLGNSNATQLGWPQSYSCQPSHAQITPSFSFDWSEFLSELVPCPRFQEQQNLYFKGVSSPTNYPSTLEQTPQLNYATGNYNGLNRIGHEGGFETFDFGSTSGAQTNNRSEASSSVSSFVEAIRKQDSEMPAEFPDILDASFDY